MPRSKRCWRLGAPGAGLGAGRGRARRRHRRRRRGHHPGPGRPGGDRQPVEPQRDHQLEHVQHPRQRERALQSALELVGRAQPRDRRPGPLRDHGHADRERPGLHHQPRRRPVRPRRRHQHRRLPRQHQRHQERGLRGRPLQFQHPGPAGCLDRQSGPHHRDQRRLRGAGGAAAQPGTITRRSAPWRSRPATAARSTSSATS